MKNAIVNLSFIFFSLVLTAQNTKELLGNGEFSILERQTKSYNVIRASDAINIQLVNGNEGKLILKGERNLLKFIDAKVKNGKLIIQSRRNFNLIPSLGNSLVVEVPIRDLNRIILKGAGSCTSSEKLNVKDLSANISGSRNLELAVEAESISIVASGSSRIVLSGTSSNMDVQLSGAGKFNSYNLNSKKVSINSSDASIARVSSSDSITGEVSGSGKVWYKGTLTSNTLRTNDAGRVFKGKNERH